MITGIDTNIVFDRENLTGVENLSLVVNLLYLEVVECHCAQFFE
jgi:hypothetical protein